MKINKKDIVALISDINDSKRLDNYLKTFENSKQVVIRWDVSYREYGMSNCAIDVPSDVVEKIVKDHFTALQKQVNAKIVAFTNKYEVELE